MARARMVGHPWWFEVAAQIDGQVATFFCGVCELTQVLVVVSKVVGRPSAERCKVRSRTGVVGMVRIGGRGGFKAAISNGFRFKLLFRLGVIFFKARVRIIVAFSFLFLSEILQRFLSFLSPTTGQARMVENSLATVSWIYCQ